MINLPSALVGNTLGTQVNDLLGSLGIQGGLIGAQVDALAGNPLGVLRNLQDGYTEAATGRATNKWQRQRNERPFGPFGLVPRPGAALRRLAPFARGYKRMDLAPGAKTGFAGLFDPRRRGAMKLEGLLRKNPLVRAVFEKAVGGKYIPDGRNDGKITIRRNPFRPLPFPGLPPHLNSVASHINGVQRGIASLAKQLKGLQNGGGERGPGNSSGPTSSGNFTNAASSFEDLLFGIMMDQMKKLQAEIEAKGGELKKLQNKKDGDKGGAKKAGGKGGKGGGKGGKGGGKGGKGGLLKTIGGIAGGAFGGPLGAMAGQAIGGAVGGAVSGGGASGGAGGAEGKGKKSEEEVTKELEQLTKKYERFLTSIDNIMSTLHKTSMSSIRKIGQ